MTNEAEHYYESIVFHLKRIADALEEQNELNQEGMRENIEVVIPNSEDESRQEIGEIKDPYRRRSEL
jgi:ferric iron reductase protein FhuF